MSVNYYYTSSESVNSHYFYHDKNIIMDTNKAIMHTIIIIAVALAMHHIATCTLATCMTRYNRNFMY